MADVSLPRGASARLGRIDGNLHAERDVTIEAEGPQGVEVSGSARFEGEARVNASLSCQELDVRKGGFVVTGALSVRGRLRGRDAEIEIHGPFSGDSVDVGRRLVFRGDAVAGEVEVGGELEAMEDLRCRSASVGGTFVSGGTLTARHVEVGGRFRAGRVDIGELEVGGLADVEGGTVSDGIEVGGRFACSGALKFGTLEVGG